MKIIDLITNIVPRGWLTKIGGVLMVLGSIGLFADIAGQEIGVDLFTQVTTWNQAVLMLGAGLSALGIRRKLEDVPPMR